MHAEPNPGASPGFPPGPDASESHADRMERFEKRQAELWRLTFFLLSAVSAVLAWLSWPTLRSYKFRLEAAPIGLLVLVALLGAYLWR